jgi:putative transcriptional regulator
MSARAAVVPGAHMPLRRRGDAYGRSHVRTAARAVAAVALAAAVATVATGWSAAALGAREASAAPQLGRGAVRTLAAGKLLVAARDLPDPNFAETVILLAEFSKDGAMGLIVNRRTEVTVARLLPGLRHASGAGSRAFFGGPVAPGGVLALLRHRGVRTDSRRVLNDVHLVNTREVLEELVSSGADASRFRIYVGYAGWGAGQLDKEAAGGAWHVLDGDARVVFDPEPESTWLRQIRRTDAISVRGPAGDVLPRWNPERHATVQPIAARSGLPHPPPGVGTASAGLTSAAAAVL